MLNHVLLAAAQRQVVLEFLNGDDNTKSMALISRAIRHADSDELNALLTELASPSPIEADRSIRAVFEEAGYERQGG